MGGIETLRYKLLLKDQESKSSKSTHVENGQGDRDKRKKIAKCSWKRQSKSCKTIGNRWTWPTLTRLKWWKGSRRKSVRITWKEMSKSRDRKIPKLFTVMTTHVGQRARQLRGEVKHFRIASPTSPASHHSAPLLRLWPYTFPDRNGIR